MKKRDLKGIIHEVRNVLCCYNGRDEILSEVALLLKEKISHYNWVGFYILTAEKDMLYLGPFAGEPTIHTSIPVGKGICGQVAVNKETMIVQDVNSQENYLSCSIDVKSEIVVPIFKNNSFVAELDIDSHTKSPFTDIDKKILEEICKELSVVF